MATLVAIIPGPLASILVSVGRFYTSPMIFAYDPFVGYFSGTLYDTLIDFSGLLSYRAGSAATLFAIVVLALHLGRDAAGHLRLRSVGRPVLALAGALAGLAGLLANVYGDRLGHWQTSATIAATLGGRTEGVRCSVVHARSMRPDDAERFARDCDAHVAVLERWFGAPGPGKITAFVFESSAQKGALMGAADTFIAKPWRREIYVQSAAYPHPVLGHELAHVIAGAFGRGPFRVAGGLGGLLPDPGIVEGTAVAAEPPAGDLLPREWAKAMKDLGLLPKLDRLFTLGFLGENAGVAYTVSGAFVGWVHDRFGAEVVRAWYGGRPLPEATGVPWAELERRWHDDLNRETLPEAARAAAKARFDRPAIFGRRCPHVVDACRVRADRLRGDGDYEGAVAAFEDLLALDPHDDGTRVAIAMTRVRQGREGDAVALLSRLAADPAVSRHVRDRALEELGDMALAEGRGDEATSRYREVMGRTLDEDALRNLEIKIEAAGDPRCGPPWWRSSSGAAIAARIAAWPWSCWRGPRWARRPRARRGAPAQALALPPRAAVLQRRSVRRRRRSPRPRPRRADPAAARARRGGAAPDGHRLRRRRRARGGSLFPSVHGSPGGERREAGRRPRAGRALRGCPAAPGRVRWPVTRWIDTTGSPRSTPCSA